MNRNLILVGASALVLTSCIALPIPHERPLSPFYFGTVTDAETGKPIEGVVVSVGGSVYSKTPIPGESKTNAMGYYEVVAKERASWYVLIVGPADGNCGGSLLFAHPEFETRFERTDQASAGGLNGTCTGVKRQLDMSLKRKGI